MSLYSKRGVSPQKEDVHNATKKLDPGLFKYSFCKILPDYLAGDENFVNIMHADGAGSKSILAYLYWKETADINVWKGIAQDAIVMNLDDLICAGVYNNILFCSTIDRNKNLITAEVLETIINSTQNIFNELKVFGINIQYAGGETADVGDVVRTITVNGTMAARWPKAKIITNEKISDGNVIVGFASDGQASYETRANSGIGSNGLTSARHDLLSKYYAKNYRETFNPFLEKEVIYTGKNKLTDEVNAHSNLSTIGKQLLSPTRTYAPLIKLFLEEFPDDIYGIIHCSGGGQTKCLKYLSRPLTVIKDNLFEPPLIFKLIQQSSGADDREMYQVFNMGHRMEIFTNEVTALKMISIANKLNIKAQIIGRTKAAAKKSVELYVKDKWIQYI